MFPTNVSLFVHLGETLLRKQNLLPRKQKCLPRNSETFAKYLQNRFAICEAFLRFCEANFIQKYKNAKLMKIH